MARVAGDLGKTINGAMESVAKDVSEEYVDLMIEEANEALRRAPPQGASQEEWNMEGVIDSVEKRWDGSGWVAEWTHEHAHKLEVGVRPFQVEDQLMVFEDEDGETVFTMSIDHPGVPAVGYIRAGKRRVRRALSEGGI